EPLHTCLGHWAGSVDEHHERWDGKGYPQGLAGKDISLGGRILAIGDAYEVMTATRAYKVPLSAAAAREELLASAGAHFDPALVRAFMGISLGALWWTAGVSALLAQIPLLGRVGALPGLSRIRSGLAGTATAVAVVAVLATAGVVDTGHGQPAAARAESARSAAPVSPPPAPPVSPSTPVPVAASATPTTLAAAAPTSPARPVAARPTTPTVDRLLEALPLTPPTTVPPTGGSPGSAPASPAPASPAPAGPPAPAP